MLLSIGQPDHSLFLDCLVEVIQLRFELRLPLLEQGVHEGVLVFLHPKEMKKIYRITVLFGHQF